MSEITLSSAVRNNLLSLQNTAELLGRTQERLATGLKVNSALDDPTAFFTAASLNSRASDLNRLLDSVGNALQTIRAADQGIEAITSLVESAQASARQALQTSGPVTSSTAVGSTSATYNPQSLTTIVGTGSTLTADAAASLQTSANLGGDAANAAATSTNNGSNATTLSAAGVSAGDTLVITNGSTTHTITFDANTVANVTGDNFTIGVDQDLDAFVAAINDADFTGVTASVDGSGAITLTAQASDDFLRIQDGVGTVTADLGFGAVGVGADATNRLVTKNSVLDDLVLAGYTLTVQRGSDAATTITFGVGANQVNTQAGLIAALNGATGVSATASGTNQITIANETTTDYDTNITLNTSNATVFSTLGITADSGQTTLRTIQPNNLLTQAGGLTAGQTLQIDFGSQSNTITFGTGANQVSSLAELNTTLNAITGGAASVAVSGASLGNISLTASSPSDTITIGGTASAVAEFGLTAGEFSNLVNGASGPVQQGDTLSITVGTNSTLTVTFGTGTGQVNTLAELKTALSALSGGTATIDDQTGAITITATNGSDNIVVAEGNAREAGAFGLTAQTYTSTTTNSSERAALEQQFNDIRVQIDQLARDASFNGNNLLQGDNLKVIFNEDATSSLTINGVDFDSGGLGINAAATNAFQSDANINTSLAELEKALSTLRSQASTFGSQLSTVEIRQDFTKNLINTLETGAGNLTLADSNEEGANTLALQTRQQLSSVALSLASQADQQVLRLF
ncbi:MAG: DUF1522 domain-containing protein [Methyloligellaceae bacterium]